MLLSQGKGDARIGGKSRRRARNDASAARSETLAALRRCTQWPLVKAGDPFHADASLRPATASATCHTTRRPTGAHKA